MNFIIWLHLSILVSKKQPPLPDYVEPGHLRQAHILHHLSTVCKSGTITSLGAIVQWLGHVVLNHVTRVRLPVASPKRKSSRRGGQRWLRPPPQSALQRGNSNSPRAADSLKR